MILGGIYDIFTFSPIHIFQCYTLYISSKYSFQKCISYFCFLDDFMLQREISNCQLREQIPSVEAIYLSLTPKFSIFTKPTIFKLNEL